MNRDSHRFPYSVSYLAERILASDPTLDRLRSSLRAVLTAAISAGLLLIVTRLLGQQYMPALAGVVVPMMSVVAIQDAGRKAQQVTMAWVPVVACAALLLGSAVGANPWLSGGCFVAIIFAAFQVRRFGPRGAGLGTIAYLSFFYAILLKTPPAQAPWDLLFVPIGCAIAFATHFWLVPEHPGRMLRSEVRAYRARIGALLHDLVRLLEHGGRSGETRVDAHIAALNDQSLALESRLDGFASRPHGPEKGAPSTSEILRENVLRCELAAETVASVARSAGDAGAAAAADGADSRWRPALALRLRELARGLGTRARASADAGAGTSASANARANAAAAFDPAAWQASLPLPPAQRWRLGRAARVLASLAPWRGPLPAMRDEHKPPPAAPQAKPAPRAGSANPAGPAWLDDTSRRALQASAAALGAILGGHLLSAQYWYWSVISAFIVFTRAVTVGQTMSQAWLRVLATVAGVGLGMLVAELAHGNPLLELVLLFVFIAIGFYAFRGLPNVYVVLLTAMLAMLYELIGKYSPGLLLPRLGETIIGAACAVLSAWAILPVRTSDESGSKSAALLHVASRLLDASFSAQTPPPTPPRSAIRDLDRTLQALRESLESVTGASSPVAKEGHRRRLDQLSRIVYCVRHYYNLAADSSTGVARSEALGAAAHGLAAKLETVAAMLEAPRPQTQSSPGVAPPAPAKPQIDRSADADGDGALALQVAIEWLREADQMADAVQAELAAPPE